MSILSFETLGADLQISVNGRTMGREVRSLSYRVTPIRGEHIELTTGENFSTMEGRITVRSDAAGIVEGMLPLGGLHYFKAFDDDIHPFAASYLADILIGAEQLAILVDAATKGCMPSHILLEVEGMRYGNAPDGSEKIWDNEKSPRVKATELTLRLPLVPKMTEVDEEPKVSEQVLPPTREQVRELVAAIGQASTLLSARSQTAIWLLVAVATILLIFHH